ncbi:hypothetical protein TSAR_000336 [Trichomalopsis sarcophagae]|uniref:Protein FRA10AC1 n=1 Tax=Trichomalopsis sarcophagae TaxID=543379 RepID=A0A232EZ16_9HYME|nr:hypothetical protein TSAR_000336 [Trichomalopsis sarcophagae]
MASHNHSFLSDDNLFKEYCIGDLTNYKHNQIALRWRTEKEVLSGKGESICGNRKCTDTENLKSWEVNFKYVENGKTNNTLVKLRLCEVCSVKLNYTRRSKSHKKGNYDGDSKTGKQDQSKDLASSAKNSNDDVESKKDSESDLWKNQNFQEIEINFDNKMDAYLHDLF